MEKVKRRGRVRRNTKNKIVERKEETIAKEMKLRNKQRKREKKWKEMTITKTKKVRRYSTEEEGRKRRKIKTG